ncbi:MAG: fibrinogen-like YCDxxxxGGGW domain-containing protein [Patescibacteria group bacterium]
MDGSPTVLTGGNWNQAGTNYSAGNPDYPKLKLNPEKFKVGYRGIENATAAFDSKYLVVGAFDAAVANGNKTRSVSYFQVAGISPATGVAVVTGNFPATQSGGSVVGLIRDSKISGFTGALVDGANSSLPVGCSATSKTVNGRSYSVPAMTNGTAAPVAFNTPVTGGNVAYSQDFSCSNGTVTTSGAETGGSTVCLSGYSLISAACVPATCQSIKNAYPSSADGTYSIDPDGIGAGAAFSALCDMTTDGGGWTLVSYAGTISGTPKATVGVSNGTYAKPLFFDFGTYDAGAKTTKTSFSKVRQFRPLFTETTEYLARRTGNPNNMVVFPMPASTYSTWF